MVKRRKEEDIAGVLEFEGHTAQDPEFMDWVAEVHPDRLMAAERALDHKIGNRVQRAYLRTDLLDQRRELAELWACQLTNTVAGHT